MFNKLAKLLTIIAIASFSTILADQKKDPADDLGYTPFYTGPLLAASAHNQPPNSFNIQPYLYVKDTFGEYNRSWSFVSEPDTISTTGQVILQTGIFKWLDISCNLAGNYNTKKGHNAWTFSDAHVSLGFQFLMDQKGKPWPAIRMTLTETFPSGKYQHLNPNKLGIDAGGGGSYETTFALLMSNVMYWIKNHPFQWRLNFAYTVPTDVTVKGFNAYGGGYGTNGKINPGNVFNFIAAIEFSFTQKFAFAMDLTYSEGSIVKFSGINGTTAAGLPASNTSGPNKVWTLAPALEYNFSENLGIIGGVWFTMVGENSTDFVSGVLSMVYNYP
jgi:hypothetical protein